jgi:PKD repeat protein
VVTISADDGKGGSCDVTFALAVSNVAPSVGPVVTPLDPVQFGSPVAATAGFEDPAGSLDAPYTCTVNYGDGTGELEGVASEGTCTGPDHVYGAPGVYSVAVTVSDKDGASTTVAATNLVVVYDPAGGFVTGGGWIASPAGAYTPDPSLSGKANFGFNSRYKKGATVPTGQTQFRFRMADFSFHSDEYQWLVVAGPHAKFKGWGTINGTGDYGFMVTATDGQISGGGGTDRFRIKIWDSATEGIVYDNQPGDSDDAEATDGIEGGSIVIHSGTASKLAGQLPAETLLCQNNPNPFNAATAIRYQLATPGEVFLAIYNVQGQVVRVLVRGPRNAGRYEIRWDGLNSAGQEVSTGVYIYRLVCGDLVATRRMLLMK